MGCLLSCRPRSRQGVICESSRNPCHVVQAAPALVDSRSAVPQSSAGAVPPHSPSHPRGPVADSANSAASGIPAQLPGVPVSLVHSRAPVTAGRASTRQPLCSGPSQPREGLLAHGPSHPGPAIAISNNSTAPGTTARVSAPQSSVPTSTQPPAHSGPTASGSSPAEQAKWQAKRHKNHAKKQRQRLRKQQQAGHTSQGHQAGPPQPASRQPQQKPRPQPRQPGGDPRLPHVQQSASLPPHERHQQDVPQPPLQSLSHRQGALQGANGAASPPAVHKQAPPLSAQDVESLLQKLRAIRAQEEKVPRLFF